MIYNLIRKTARTFKGILFFQLTPTIKVNFIPETIETFG